MAALSVVLSGMLLTGFITPLVLSSAPAGADQIATLKERAQWIAEEIQSANVKLSILDENYLQAKSHVAWLASRVTDATKAIERTEVALGHDRSHLRQVAIEAYVTGNASQSLSVLFNGSQQNAGMQQTYIQAASGNLSETEATVLIAQFKLKTDRNTLDHTEAIAKANEHAISNDISQAKAIAAQLANEQAQVKGQLVQAVAAAEAAKAAAFRAALAKAAEQAAAQAAAAQRQEQQQQQQQATTAAAAAGSPAAGSPATTTGTGSSVVGRWLRPDRRERRSEPARRPLRLGRRYAGGRVRLLGPHDVGLGPGRRLARSRGH